MPAAINMQRKQTNKNLKTTGFIGVKFSVNLL